MVGKELIHILWTTCIAYQVQFLLYQVVIWIPCLQRCKAQKSVGHICTIIIIIIIIIIMTHTNIGASDI